MSNDDPPDCSAMKAAYYAKVIRVIAFQLKVNDAVPPFLRSRHRLTISNLTRTNIGCGPSLVRCLKFEEAMQ